MATAHLHVALDSLRCVVQHSYDYAPHWVLSDATLPATHWLTGGHVYWVGYRSSEP